MKGTTRKHDRRTFAIAIALVGLSTFALPFAEDHFLFNGHGFGTILAQVLFWFSWRLVATATANDQNISHLAVVAVQLVLNIGLFLLLAALLLLAARLGKSINTWRWLTLLTAAYLGALFIAPQATFGP